MKGFRLVAWLVMEVLWVALLALLAGCATHSRGHCVNLAAPNMSCKWGNCWQDGGRFCCSDKRGAIACAEEAR